MNCVSAVKLILTSMAIVIVANLLSSIRADEGRRQTLDFPASGALVSQSTEELWLFGGHRVAKFGFVGQPPQLQLQPAHLQRAEQTTAVAPLRVDLADSTVTAVVELASTRLLIAGTHAQEFGWLGRYDFTAGDFVWSHLELERPITSMTLFGERVVVGNDAGELSAFDVATGQLQWEQAPHAKMVTSLLRIADTLGASGDWTGKIVLWDPATGQSVGDFQQHRDRIVSLALAGADNASLVTASRDGTVRLWYPKQRRMVRFVQLDKPITALAALSATEVVVATSDARLHQIDLERAKVVATYDSQISYVTQLIALEPSLVLAVQGTGLVAKIELRP